MSSQLRDTALGNSPIRKEEAENLPHLGPEFSLQSSALLEKVWNKYSPLSALHLSSLTHLPDTPWYQVWETEGGKDKKCVIIPDDLIKAFYKQKLETKSGSGH